MGHEAPSADERAGERGAGRHSTSTDRSASKNDRRFARLPNEPDGSRSEYKGRRGTREPARTGGTGGSSDERAAFSPSVRGRNGRLTAGLRAVCFWTAIVLPFLYMPLLVAGIDTRPEGLALFVLLALNVVSLLAGHSYRN